jgi:hypothetical protein
MMSAEKYLAQFSVPIFSRYGQYHPNQKPIEVIHPVFDLDDTGHIWKK